MPTEKYLTRKYRSLWEGYDKIRDPYQAYVNSLYNEKTCHEKLFWLICGYNFPCPECGTDAGWKVKSKNTPLVYRCLDPSCRHELSFLKYNSVLGKKPKTSPVGFFKLLNTYDPESKEKTAATARRVGLSSEATGFFLAKIAALLPKFEAHHLEKIWFSNAHDHNSFNLDYIQRWHVFFFTETQTPYCKKLIKDGKWERNDFAPPTSRDDYVDKSKPY